MPASANSLPNYVSRETLDLLEQYADLIRKWTVRINLVAPSQMDDLWNRHILDGYQIVEHIPEKANDIIDIGSGGGLPGLVIAIHAKAHHPNRSVALVESDQRKSAFLRTVVRELKLNASVHTQRIENVDLPPADVVTARALAPLDQLLSMALPHLRENGHCIFPKGKSAASELENARQTWQFTCQEVQSLTDNEARLLVIRNMRRGIL